MPTDIENSQILFIGVPCRTCGESVRYIKNRNCVGCNVRGHAKWTKENPEKTKQAAVRYREKHSSRLKTERLRKRYGLSSEEVRSMFARQQGKCLGCQNSIQDQPKGYHIDHNHKTGAVRGLLCVQCNMALGLIHDRQITLRRLMAYLDYDRTRLNVYVIGALKNPRIPILGNLLRAENYDVMDEWYTPGEYADTNWQAYEKLRGRTYAQAIRGRAATNIQLFDQSYLDLADVAVLVMPAGKSAMLEIGYAQGKEKHTCVFLDGQELDRYDVMPGLVDEVLKTQDELLQWLKWVNQEVMG